MNKELRTEIEKLGEFGLIKHLTDNNSSVNDSTIKAVGDDAAIIKAGDHVKVVSTDLLLEGVHFDLSYVPLKHLGYKSVIVNLSDIYAMNATPKQITVSIAMSNRFSLEAIEEIYQGIYLACTNYGVDLVGGDTSASKQGLLLSISAIGEAKEEEIIYRSGAKEKELLVVSGDLGGAYMGLQLLEREKSVFMENPEIQPDLDGNDYLLERQLKPEARHDIITLLKKLDVRPTSMIDISDGLASEVIHLCDQSGLGAQLFDEKIPIDPLTYERARDFQLDPDVVALNGGEDYELLFTIKQDDYKKIKGNPNLTVVGHMQAKDAGIHLVDKNGNKHALSSQGWDAFLNRKNL